MLAEKADPTGESRGRTADRTGSGGGADGHPRMLEIVAQESARRLCDGGARITAPDVTDDPLHGNQEGGFFHGYDGHYCSLLLYIFAGDHRLCARLQPPNIDASAGCAEEVARIVAQIRQVWPEVRITLRADSGFCREKLMGWCERNRVDYVPGLAKNERLKAEIMEECVFR